MRNLPIFAAILLSLLSRPALGSIEIYDVEPSKNVTIQWSALSGQLFPALRQNISLGQQTTIEQFAFDGYFSPNPAYPYEIYPGAPLIMTLSAYSGSQLLWQAPEVEFTPYLGFTGPYSIWFPTNGPDGPLEMQPGQTLSLAVSFAEIQPYQDPTGRWVYSEAGFYTGDDGSVAMQMWGEQAGLSPQAQVCEPAVILLGMVACLLLWRG